MVDFNDMVVRIINESKPLLFPPGLEEAYEKIMKHIESYSSPKEWSQGIYMPKEIIIKSSYDTVPDFPESKTVGKLLKTEPGYNRVRGGLDGLRNYISVMVTNGLKADKISKKYPKAYSKGSLSANFQHIHGWYKAPVKYSLSPLKNDNDIKKMFYDAILNCEVNIPRVPGISIKVNLNGVEDELYVDFFLPYRYSRQLNMGIYSPKDNDSGATRNIIYINLPQIISQGVKISSVKDFSTQWPKNYSSNPEMNSLTVSHILQMFDTRNTRRLSTVVYVRETIRHELMHYYERFFKQKNISSLPDEIDNTGDEREAFLAKTSKRIKAPYLTRNAKITGRIAEEFYPRLRELLEVVPKDALEGFLRTLDIKPLKKFFLKRLGVKHSLTKVNLGQEQWLAATLKVPYLKRKLLEKIYNFINNK